MKNRIVFVLIVALFTCATAWSADSTQTQTKGKPLPADGGEPWKAYMAYWKALDSGDVAALKKLMTAENVKDMDKPEFKEFFPIMRSMHAKEIKFVAGTSDEKTATIQATGKDPSGKASKGTITMALENKEWKMKEDAWSTQIN